MKRKTTSTYLLLGLLTPLGVGADLQIKSPRVAPDRSLKIKSSGVPAFDLVDKSKGARVASVPALNIGTESELIFQETSLNLPVEKKFEAGRFGKVTSATPMS